MSKQFKDFALKGRMVDMAVDILVGTVWGCYVVTS